MYLSKLIINTDNPISLRSLVDPYEAHRTIWHGFPDKDSGGPGRVLFRVEYQKTYPRLVVLVQSHLKPDWQPLISKGILLSEDCLEYSEKLELLAQVGQSLRFRLRANPTKKTLDVNQTRPDGNPRPVRVGLLGDEEQIGWLKTKAENGGFKLINCRISGRERSESKKAGIKGKITHMGVTFDGLLEVTDKTTFINTLESGIGSAKGFGFGLLSVIPVR